MIPFFCLQVQDQIDVTKQLVDLYPFIDKSRVSRYFPREYFRYILAASHLCTLLFLPFFTFHLQAANWGIENLARVKHLANSMSVSSRWPSGVGAMVASSPPRFSPQMLIRATSSRSRVIFSEFSCCCEFEIISSYLFLVRHQRCPCDQLDLL